MSGNTNGEGEDDDPIEGTVIAAAAALPLVNRPARLEPDPADDDGSEAELFTFSISLGVCVTRPTPAAAAAGAFWLEVLAEDEEAGHDVSEESRADVLGFRFFFILFS